MPLSWVRASSDKYHFNMVDKCKSNTEPGYNNPSDPIKALQTELEN